MSVRFIKCDAHALVFLFLFIYFYFNTCDFLLHGCSILFDYEDKRVFLLNLYGWFFFFNACESISFKFSAQ